MVDDLLFILQDGAIKRELLAWQEKIVSEHFGSGNGVLDKDEESIMEQVSSSLYGKVAAQYKLAGKTNQEAFPFVPHFQYEVGTWYEITFPWIKINSFSAGDQGGWLYLDVSDPEADAREIIQASVPKISSLFEMRNKALQKELSSLLQVQFGQKKTQFDFDVRTGMYVQATSRTYGDLIARIDSLHAPVEEIVEQFLQTIDRRTPDYLQLFLDFEEFDDEGNALSADSHLQSVRYTRLRRQLHTTLFGDLIKGLEEKGIKTWLYLG